MNDLSELRRLVCDANLRIVNEGLVLLTWGNASAVDRVSGVVVIKPSGVPAADLKPERMSVVSLETGSTVGDGPRPSSDTPTHLELYRAFPSAGAIVHTHSRFATAWAQAGREIPVLGTTHADHFRGPIPVTRTMTKREIARDYELNTGRVIVQRFKRLDPADMPAVLVRGHAPFVWGRTVQEAVENAVVLECVAEMAAVTVSLARGVRLLSRDLLDKHFLRKHGPKATYGQGPK
jgi:L-ribulose-5-phosphate 4-epimerase